MNSPKIELILAVSDCHWEEIKDPNPSYFQVGFGHFGTEGLAAAEGILRSYTAPVIKIANPWTGYLYFPEPITPWLQVGR
jgi:hypothetical protein